MDNNETVLSVKHYKELTTDELHDIYRIRAEVFVVEQKCIYQDIDGNDKDAYHLWLRDSSGMIAYLRVLPRRVTFDDVSIGRVLCVKRRQGYATRLIEEGIRVAKEKYGADRITIAAQLYARGLYEKAGFVQTSDVFMEDDIEHIKMTLNCE